MIHEIRTSPGYDRRGETPNYGQHPLELHFLVRGDEGALVFTVVTGWPPSELKSRQIGSSGSFSSFTGAPYCVCSFHAVAALTNVIDNDPHEDCGWLGCACVAHEPFGYTGKALGDLFFTLNFSPLEEFWALMDKHYKEIVDGLH